MDIDEVKRNLCGPMIPVITHLQSDLSIDHGATRETVTQDIDRGIQRGQGVLLVGGAGGDFPMLSIEERKQVAETVVDAAQGRVPVLIGAQDTNPEACVAMARCAEQVGAYGIQMSPTFYYQPSDDDCLRLFERVHEAAPGIALMAYNTYWEGYNMSLDQVERLCELPRVVSLKWATPDTKTYLRGVERFSGRLAVVDNQGLTVMNHMLGGTGFITHLATIWPEHDLSVFRLLQEQDYVAAQRKISAANWPWQSFRGKMWNRTGAESPVIKAALELCGRAGGPSRLPTRSLTADEKEELRSVLRKIGVPDAG